MKLALTPEQDPRQIKIHGGQENNWYLYDGFLAGSSVSIKQTGLFLEAHVEHGGSVGSYIQYHPYCTEAYTISLLQSVNAVIPSYFILKISPYLRSSCV